MVLFIVLLHSLQPAKYRGLDFWVPQNVKQYILRQIRGLHIKKLYERGWKLRIEIQKESYNSICELCWFFTLLWPSVEEIYI